MLILDYPSKKELKTQIGQRLKYIETSIFEPEYDRNGWNTGCNRPHITGHKREFFARVECKDGLIVRVE